MHNILYNIHYIYYDAPDSVIFIYAGHKILKVEECTWYMIYHPKIVYAVKYNNSVMNTVQ